MASKYWIKLYHEILHDHKMGTMPDRLWRRTIEIFLMAGEYDRDGELPPVEEMAWTLRISNDECNESLHELQRLCIVHCNDNATWVVTNFKERQDASTGTERSRESRRRKRQNEDKNTEKQPKNDDSNATKTQRNVAPDTDTDTDTDNNIPLPISKTIKQKKPKGEKQQENCDMFKALADLCQLDLNLITDSQRGALNQAGKKMRDNGHTPADLKNYSEWWYANDWRGKQGQPPTLTQIRETWGQFKSGRTQNGQQKHSPLNGTGKSLSQRPTFDPYTGTVVMPNVPGNGSDQV